MMSLFKSACAQIALSVLLEADLAHAFQWTLPPLTHSDQTELYKDQCPKFACNDSGDEKQSRWRYLSDQVYCFKSDFRDPLSVHFKNCAKVAHEEGNWYDVFGNPYRNDSDRNLFCHGELNRCMSDPFVKFSDRLLGSACSASYQCGSKHCSSEGICTRQTNISDFTATGELKCASHIDCDKGHYCSTLLSKPSTGS